MRRFLMLMAAMGALIAAGCARAPQQPPPPQPPPAAAPAPRQEPAPAAETVVQASVQLLTDPGLLPYFTGLTTAWRANGHDIYRTTDGGANWVKLYETDHPVRRFAATSPQRVWAVTDGGLLATEDGGLTWAPLWAGDALTSLRFVDDRHGWATGTGGILFTQDGGRSWTPVAMTHPCDGADARYSFTGKDTGWVLCAGQPGAGAQSKWVYATTDRGQTWQLVAATVLGEPVVEGSPARGGYVSGFYFADNTHGWITHSRGGLEATDDGGKTWRGVPFGPGGEQFLGIDHFMSPDVGFVTSRQGNYTGIAGTQDGGATWTQVYPPLAPARAFSGAIPMHFFNGQQGIAAGTALQPGAILTTADGGHTWSQVASIKANRVLTLRFSDPEHGTLLAELWTRDGTERTLYETHDGGMTWAPTPLAQVAAGADSWEPSPPGYKVWAYCLLPEGRAWVIGETDDHRHVLLSTSDSGQSWTRYDLGALRPVAVTAADASHVWVVDEQGNLFHSQDGGRSWTQLQ
jgi:photosystem II stability/assembly factor-like uncharacterized protein